MITRGVVALPLALLLAACSAPRIDGHWVGTVDEGDGRTEIVLELRTGGGGASGTMSLPGHRLLGKALTGVSIHGERIALTLPAHVGPLHFAGTLRGDEIAGSVDVQGRAIPLRLHRAAAPAVPYREEPVAFRAADGTTLRGALLLPPGGGPFPAVILIHGSSTPSRDDYRYFADLYARAGVAALIYDKRPTEGEVDGGTATLETLGGDVLAAAAALEQRSDIDRHALGLFGFSQGGWVAPIAAARRPFAFVAVLSAPGVSFAEVAIYADTTRLRRRGFAPADIAEAEAAQRRVDSFVRSGGRGDRAALQGFLDAAAARPWARFTSLPRRVPESAAAQRVLRWHDLDLDPAPYWRRLHAPVFLALGAADENVPAAESARRIEAALAAGGNCDVTVRLYPGANHSLEPAPTLDRELVSWTLAALRRRPRG